MTFPIAVPFLFALWWLRLDQPRAGSGASNRRRAAWNRVSLLLTNAAGAGVARSTAARRATMMGTVFLSLFLDRVIVGWLGGVFKRVTPSQF